MMLKSALLHRRMELFLKMMVQYGHGEDIIRRGPVTE